MSAIFRFHWQQVTIKKSNIDYFRRQNCIPQYIQFSHIEWGMIIHFITKTGVNILCFSEELLPSRDARQISDDIIIIDH